MAILVYLLVRNHILNGFALICIRAANVTPQI